MALSAKCQKMLQQCRQENVSAIHQYALLPLALSKHLITEEEISDDCYCICKEQRNLLDITAKKGAIAFVSVVKEKDKHLGHESLAKTLEKEKERLSKFPSLQTHRHNGVCTATIHV